MVTYATSPSVEAIRRLIQDELEPGDQLPSEQALTVQLGVSRATVRDALARLAADGLVEKRWGVGTFVSEREPRTTFGMLSIRPGIPGILASSGGVPSVHRFDVAELPPDRELFPDFPEVPTFSLTRIFAIDDVPAVMIKDRVVSRFGDLVVDPSPLHSVETLVADVLKEAGTDLATLEVDLAAAQLDDEGRSLFGLSKPEPVIRTSGFGYDPDSRRILAARGVYRTRIIHLRLTVT